MKRTFFNPAHLKPIRSRRMLGSASKGSLMAMIAYASGDNGDDDDDDDDDDEDGDDKPAPAPKPKPVSAEERKKLEQRFMKQITKNVKDALEGRVTKEELDDRLSALSDLLPDAEGKGGATLEALRKMADEKTGVMPMIMSLDLRMKKMENTSAGKQPNSTSVLSIRSQCENFLAKNKDAIQNILAGEEARLPNFDIELSATRAVANPMLPATAMPDGSTYITSFEVDNTINIDPRNEPTIWNGIPKGKTSKETLVWLNKTPTEGKAEWIGPGEYKPPISFAIEPEISNAKKLAVSSKMAIELLDDIDGFYDFVISEIRYAIEIELNSAVYSSVATTKKIAGLSQYAVPYDALTGVVTTTPNYYDAIQAAITMLRVKRYKGKILVVLNTVDNTNMNLTKAISQGQLYIPRAIQATFVESEDIPVGTFMVVAIDYYKIKIYKGFSMAWGLENDDFTKNLRTVIGEMRLHQFVQSAYNELAVKDTFANVLAAIKYVEPVEP